MAIIDNNKASTEENVKKIVEQAKSETSKVKENDNPIVSANDHDEQVKKQISRETINRKIESQIEPLLGIDPLPYDQIEQLMGDYSFGNSLIGSKISLPK